MFIGEFGIKNDEIEFNWNSTLLKSLPNIIKYLEISKAFNAYQYTKNPYLVISNQYLALKTSSCVSILERILSTIKINKIKSKLTDKK